MSADVTVIGGGVIGLAIADQLAERGAAVTVLERAPAVGTAASFGNAGIVGPTHVLPLPSWEAIREGLSGLLRPDSPLALRPHLATVPWLARFVAAATPRRVAASTATLSELAEASLAMHREFAKRRDTGFTHNGFLNVFETHAGFAAAAEHLSADHDEVLDSAATRQRWPQMTGTVAGAILNTRDAHCDPARLVAALAAEATDRGAQVRTGVEVLGARRRGERVSSLRTSTGDLQVGEVVLAAGVWSASLARELGARLPILGGKGYHLELPSAPTDPDLPVYFSERRVVTTPLNGRIRVGGTLEITDTDMSVDTRRVDAILSVATERLAGLRDRQPLTVWRGLRPCTPDGLPVIGRVRERENVTIAAGHGMWGLQLSLVTGRLVAELISGLPVSHDLQPLAPGRFARVSL
jgi:D-amino-acid dehydrogenase